MGSSSRKWTGKRRPKAEGRKGRQKANVNRQTAANSIGQKALSSMKKDCLREALPEGIIQ
jgi:hypothetical protein